MPELFDVATYDYTKVQGVAAILDMRLEASKTLLDYSQ